MNFDKKVCVVTGAANGIGRAILEEFLKSGAHAAFSDVDVEAGKKLVNKWGNDKLLFVAGDLTQEEHLNQFTQAIKNRFSHVDYLINNAGIGGRGILSDISYNDFNYLLKLKITAPYMLSKLLLDSFATGGVIINIASTRAFMSQPDTESYSAANGGMCALTHALSISLAGKVRVNSISPGWIDTGAYQKDEYYQPKHSQADIAQHPAGRIGTPLDIAKMVLFLCSETGSFITGENIIIDGGMSKQMIYNGDYGWNFNFKQNITQEVSSEK